MNEELAKRLIEQTFDAPFQEEQFVRFAQNLVNRIDLAKAFSHSGNLIKDAYEDHINQYKRVGTYTTDGGETVDILIVKLKRESSLNRARTMQRNFVAQYLKQRDGKDAALVAYYSEDAATWRFSYVKMEYELAFTEEGVQAEEKVTPARRFSFLVGTDEPNHTAKQQLLPILQSEHNPSIADLEEAFNIESVTKEFFERYKELFLTLKEELDSILERNQRAKQEFIAKNIETANFAKKLLGQIVFLYFLQKKGWLGVQRDRSWGSGDKDFLLNKFKAGHYASYFQDILEPLFYEALAVERPNHYYEKLSCRIPFLNGGLFEPMNRYDWQADNLPIRNEIFGRIFETFGLYNFTVREDEPLDKEVAVDPEMLGKVFENLLEVTDRKSKGAFYTPREIVTYMCQESLINYLDTVLNQIEENLAGEKLVQKDMFSAPQPKQESLKVKIYNLNIPREDLEQFIRYSELVGEHEQQASEKESRTYQHVIPVSIRENAEALDTALSDVKICDPAVGSGAFPVGMMQEIVRARTALSIYLDSNNLRDAYRFKWHCIENSLYGVDIDPGAIEVAKLRLWLSLVVDEDDYDDIRPLPNLDYKIVCGNALLSVDQSDKLFQWKKFSDLENKKIQYFNSTSRRNKQILKEEIDSLLNELLGKHGLFDFKINFSEITKGRGGFDIVIANPPYLESRSPNFSNAMKNDLQNSVKRKLGKKSNAVPKGADLLIYFLLIGTEIIKDDGTCIQIVQNSWLNTEYGIRFQNYLREHTNVVALIDSAYKYFDTANINTVITIFQGKQPRINEELPFVKYRTDYANIGLTTLLNNPEIAKEYADIKVVSKSSNLLKTMKWGTLQIADEDTFRFLEALSEKAKDINEVAPEVSIGQGLNVRKSYSVSEEEVRQFKIPDQALIPFIGTRGFSFFRLKSSNLFLIDADKISSYLAEQLAEAGIQLFDKASTRKIPPILVMPRGIGSTHYCLHNETGGFSDSCVDVYYDSENVNFDVVLRLWLFFNSSAFWFIRELTGRKNLGGGMLKAEAVDIKNMPLYLGIQDISTISRIYDELSLRDAKPVLKEIKTKEHLEIDKLVYDHLGLSESAQQGIKRMLIGLVNDRRNKSKT